MIRLVRIALLLAITIGPLACAEKDTQAPNVIATVPSNGEMNVDPSIREISVTFDEEMQDGNWSWVYTIRSQFPEMDGDPFYTQDFTKNTLPVKLESNKEYVIWINSQNFNNFKDKAGNSAVPFKLVFKTR